MGVYAQAKDMKGFELSIENEQGYLAPFNACIPERRGNATINAHACRFARRCSRTHAHLCTQPPFKLQTCSYTYAHTRTHKHSYIQTWMHRKTQGSTVRHLSTYNTILCEDFPASNALPWYILALYIKSHVQKCDDLCRHKVENNAKGDQ